MKIKKYYGVESTNEYGTIKRPFVKMTIDYNKGDAGYLSYYSLYLMRGREEHREGAKYTMESFGIDFIPSSILLSTVARKSVKEQARLEEWMEANADGIMANFMFGTVGSEPGNMKAVFNYVMAHRPGKDKVGVYQEVDRFHSRPLSEAFDGYTAYTQAMWDLSTMTDDAEKTKEYVKEQLEHYAELGMYRHMTELYLVCAWMHEYGKYPINVYAELATMVQDKVYGMFESDSSEVQYFVNMID